MFTDWVLFLVSICLTLWSYFSILLAWDQTNLANFYSVWAGVSIATSVAITFIFMLVHKQLSQVLEHWSYHVWIALLYARSCHVWVESVTNQKVINVCGKILTLGAPLTMNMTCDCPIQVKGHHALPFLTSGDEMGGCYFEDNQETLKWVMGWEALIFSAIIVHIAFMALSVIGERKRIVWSTLFVTDILACLSIALIPIVPTGHYSMYQIGGTIRFLGLMHAIIPFEPVVKSKKLVGVLIVFKLVFVTLTGAAMMFVAEKPCSSMHSNCDEGFGDFGNTVYFIFVTLSTVGYGDMSPKTAMGKCVIVVIILAAISYLPNIISDILEMCRKNPLHGRIDELHDSIRQVGFLMHGGTNAQHRLRKSLKRRNPKRSLPNVYED